MAEYNIVAVSDLHIGAPSSLFGSPTVQRRFIDEVRKFGDLTHFILLGDILDLTVAPGVDAWNRSAAFFHMLFSQIPPHMVIYYLPGNHDHHVLALCVEERSLTSKLNRHLMYASPYMTPPAIERMVMAPVALGPSDATFVHGLFPKDARDRLTIHYPMLALPAGQKALYFHHGHYFDRYITPLALPVARQHPGETGITYIEEANFPFIEGVFHLFSLSRTSKDFLVDTYLNFKNLFFLLSPLFKGATGLRRLSWVSVFRWLTASFRGHSGETLSDTICGLNVNLIKELMRLIYQKDSYVLIFGHTHKAKTWSSDCGTIKMYNTGGWLVEKTAENPAEVYPCIFHAQADEFELKPFQVSDAEKKEAAQRASNVYPPS